MTTTPTTPDAIRTPDGAYLAVRPMYDDLEPEDRGAYLRPEEEEHHDRVYGDDSPLGPGTFGFLYDDE